MTSKHLVVRGRVQGVFYRASACERAGELGVAGWVRNRDDGAVEMLLEGEDNAVEQMVAWARRGPSGADVNDVDITEQTESGLTGFDQR